MNARKIAATPAKIKLYLDVSNSIMYSLEKVSSEVFASITTVKPPIPISVKAGKSYFQFIFSPKYFTERNVLKAIAEIEFVDMSTRLTNGRTAIYMPPPSMSIQKPICHMP